MQNAINIHMAFWGNRDATIVFYEVPYNQSNYIAEFYNSLSGLIYTVIGILFLKTKIYKMGQTMVVLGIGTASLHATQRWQGQCLDEVSMLYLSYQVITHIRTLNNKKTSRLWIPAGLTIYAQSYNFVFILLFAISQVYILFALKKPTPKKEFEMQAYIYNKIYKWLFLASGIIWSIEHVGYYPNDMYHLHAWWHIGTGVSIFFGLKEILICT